MNEHLIKHGDAVKDIAICVEDLDGIVKVRTIGEPVFCALHADHIDSIAEGQRYGR